MEERASMSSNGQPPLLAGQHVIVINRWRERYADYARYLDHERLRVSYITTEVGLGSVPPAAASSVLVGHTDDPVAVRAAADQLAARHGPPVAVVALKEDDLLVGAELRQSWNCRGPRPDELTVFRDKYLMCQAIQRAGLPVPAFSTATDVTSVREFASEHGWPLIVKPRIGSSSEGVVRLDGPAGLASADLSRSAMVQKFQPDPIYHVDGVYDGRALLGWRVSRYLNTCLGFRAGRFLGSVEVDEPELTRTIAEVARQFLAALTSTPLVFHLELFVGRDRANRPVCSFMEVGARAGGAEIPFVWREVHGYDLMEAALRIQLGEPPAPVLAHTGDEAAGWLLVPAPADRPCRITEVTSMVGRDPGPYAEVILRPGEVLPAADAYYEHVGGRFRFRGASTAQVQSAILATAGDFRVAGEPLTASAIAS
jgi:hypothetical protein